MLGGILPSEAIVVNRGVRLKKGDILSTTGREHRENRPGVY